MKREKTFKKCFDCFEARAKLRAHFYGDNKMKNAVLIFQGFCFLIAAFIGVGYVLNVLALIRCDWSPIDKEEILRLIGLFLPPIGGLFGWFL